MFSENSWILLAIFCFIQTTECAIFVYPRYAPSLIEQEYRDMPARFGANLTPEGLQGTLVNGFPDDGCVNLMPPPHIKDYYVEKWIVMVARYNCSFEQKVKNAQAAGYDAIIVHNVHSNDLEVMSAKDPSGITIPAVFIGEDAGIELGSFYTFDRSYFVIINSDEGFNINTHLLLPFAIVVGACLIVMIIFMIVKCIKDRRRARRHRLPNGSLKKIPTCCYSKGDPYDMCAICLDDYQEGDKLRVLPCAHAYHCKCIDPWLTKNRRVCPVCKRRVLAAGERRRRCSDSSAESEPLVPNNHNQPTGGGTFEVQRENPFVRAARLFVPSRRRARQEAAADGEPPSATTPTENPPNNSSNIAQEEPISADVVDGPTQPSQGSNDECDVRGIRRGFVPFLSGVLNMRQNHFSRFGTSSEEREPLITSASDEHPVTVQVERSRSKRKRPRNTGISRSAGDAASQSGTSANETRERGEIGVAALPNESIARNPHHYVI